MAGFPGRVEGLIKRLSSRFGTGSPLTGTLTRVASRTGPGYLPTGETTSTYDIFCIWGEFSLEERTAGLVEDGDHRLLVAADTLATEPRVGDSVTVGGSTYRVVMADVVKPGGTAILHQLRVRQ